MQKKNDFPLYMVQPVPKERDAYVLQTKNVWPQYPWGGTPRPKSVLEPLDSMFNILDNFVDIFPFLFLHFRFL